MSLETSRLGLMLKKACGQEKMQAGVCVVFLFSFYLFLNDDAKSGHFVSSTVTVLRPREHDSSLKPLPVMQVSPKKR